MNKFLIVETVVVRKKNLDNGLGAYHIVAKTGDGLLYEHNKSPLDTIDSAIMWADMLEGTTLVAQDWTPVVKVV